MQSTPEAKSANTNPPDIASLSVPDTLAALQVNPGAGLTHAEADSRRREHGYNEVAEKRGHPVRKFLGKFWGISAWMLELIMVLSALLGKYSDLAVVSALLVVNAVLSFMHGERLRKARVRDQVDRGRLSLQTPEFVWVGDAARSRSPRSKDRVYARSSPLPG